MSTTTDVASASATRRAFDEFWHYFSESRGAVAGMVFMIFIGASMFTLTFNAYGGDAAVHGLLSELPGGAMGAMLVVMLAMFLLGFVIDFIEITFVVVPIVAPPLLMMGLDPVWLGVMMALNLQTRRVAHEYLGQGGAIGIFPGGTVSTAAKPFAQPLDPSWRNFTARLVGRSNATVVPVFFDGHTSRLFQLASHLHYTLRMGLLIKEFSKRVDTSVRVVVGEPIGRDALDARAKDSKSLMAFLRQKTYELSPRPINPNDLGFEFE